MAEQTTSMRSMALGLGLLLLLALLVVVWQLFSKYEAQKELCQTKHHELVLKKEALLVEIREEKKLLQSSPCVIYEKLGRK